VIPHPVLTRGFDSHVVIATRGKAEWITSMNSSATFAGDRRKASVLKIASTTAEAFVWNSAAMAVTQKVRMKKSNASSDQP